MQEFADVLRQAGTDLERKLQSETVLYSSEAPNVPAPSAAAAPAIHRKRPWLIPTLGAALVAAAAGLYYLPVLRKSSSPTTLAILPFSSSADPATAALAGGFAEALTGRVTQFEQFRKSLTVIPVPELISRKIKDAADARKRLAASMVVSGVLARDVKGGIRLNFRVEGRDYPQPVSSVVEDPSGDVSKLEERASAAIARMLDIGIAGAQQSGGSSGSKAYEPYLRGLGYLQRWDVPENLAAALTALEEAEKADPAFPFVEIALADSYRLRFAANKDPEDLQRALQHAQKAVQLDTRLPESHVALGRVYVETAQRDLAVVEFKRVLDLDPRNWAANSGAARTYEHMGRKEEAERSYAKTVALRPYAFGPYNELANFYLRQGRYAESEAQFRKALEVTPDNAAMYSNLAVVLRRQKKFPDAISALRKSLELNPSYAAFSNLGNIYYLQSQFRDAAAAYDSALKLNDKDFRLWGARGQALEKSGADTAEVQAAFRRALEGAEQALRVKSDAARTLSLMALYQARLGEKENAKKQITQALVNPGGDYNVLTDAALVYEALGLRNEAMRWIRKALDQGYSWEEFRTDPDFAGLAK
jgi:serine/threonine-protein kinase